MCGRVYEEGVCGEGDDDGEDEEGEKHHEKNKECEGLSGKLKLLSCRVQVFISMRLMPGIVTRLQSVTHTTYKRRVTQVFFSLTSKFDTK